jgi:phosphatidate cytidylyltransferase
MSAQPDDANARPEPGKGVPRIGPDLWPRVAASVVMGLAALAIAWTGGIVFAAFWWIASVTVLWEWERIVARERLIARVTAGALVLAVAALMALHNRPLLAAFALAAAAAAVAFAGVPGRRAWTGAGALYAGALVVSLGLLQASPIYGLPAILWLFAIVWGADVAAYFAGRAIGGPRLWPRVSPGKTWSGAIAGALAGAALGLVLSLILVPGPPRIGPVFALGLAAAVVSELGDLFESAVKRRFGVKDSSHIIPGHGGVMDRLDSFIAASTFAAVVAAVNTRGPFLASGLFQW